MAEPLLKFYKEYEAVRIDIFYLLKHDNPKIEPKLLLEKTQKLLNRFIFIMFCQYANKFFPHSILIKTYNNGNSSDKHDGQGVWQAFKNLFTEIDEGKYGIGPPINTYNGWLFSKDEILETLIIKNDVWKIKNNVKQFKGGIWKRILELSCYDFEIDLNVNILGHIFEQSITSLERIKGEIDEEGHIKHKRKNDGIYYTPEYITQYIVEQTVGKYLEEYPDKLSSMKILDPACGAGVFLNQALTFLRGKHKLASEADCSILKKNLYGVDLNNESVEITKLALWLRTAKKGQKLENLDDNIKCGNSLIDDQSIAGESAFDWNHAFGGIMGSGGFDIVIGNPPYVNIDVFGHGSPIFDHLRTSYADIYMDKSDLLFYFIKKAIDLLNTNGIMGFIVSNAFLFSNKAKKLRDYILETCSVLEIVNFEQYYVFRDAGITTCILILQKNKATPTTKVYSFKNKDYTVETLIGAMNNKDKFFEVLFTKDNPFALVDDKIARLNDKIDSGHKLLGEILHVGSGMETAANKVFSFKDRPKKIPDKFLKIRMNGNMISRYYIAKPIEYLLYCEDIESFEELPKSMQEYLISHKKELSNRADKKRRKTSKWWNYAFPMHRDYYHFDKLWCSYRARNNEFVYDDTQKFIGLTNTTVIFGNNDKYHLKFILALLNSKLLNFRYKSIGKQTGGGVFEYFENQITKLPIADSTPELQIALAQKASQMIELNNKLRDALLSALNIIKSKYGPLNPTSKLENLHLLDDIEFLAEIQKAKLNLSLKREQQLMDWFKETKTSIMAISSEVQILDKAIDCEVYKLYGLTPSEIAIVEEIG